MAQREGSRNRSEVHEDSRIVNSISHHNINVTHKRSNYDNPSDLHQSNPTRKKVGDEARYNLNKILQTSLCMLECMKTTTYSFIKISKK